MIDKYKDPKDGTALTKDVKRSEQLPMCPLLFYMRPMLQQSVRNIIYYKIKKEDQGCAETQYKRRKDPWDKSFKYEFYLFVSLFAMGEKAHDLYFVRIRKRVNIEKASVNNV